MDMGRNGFVVGASGKRKSLRINFTHMANYYKVNFPLWREKGMVHLSCLKKKKKHRGANSRALLDSCHQNSKQPRKIQQGIADLWEPQLDQEQPRGVITWAAQDKLRAFTTRKWKEKANTEHHMKYPYIHSYLTSENVIPAMSPSPASLGFFYL